VQQTFLHSTSRIDLTANLTSLITVVSESGIPLSLLPRDGTAAIHSKHNTPLPTPQTVAVTVSLNCIGFNPH
jgi:hypothetical protein